MIVVLNIVIVLIVGAIAYWWANQGLFSALLHMLCVIAAGAVALALFEPLTVGLFLRGGWFDDYAWGVTLVGLFVFSLLIFRIISDMTIRANVNFPNWANFAIGLPLGAFAGVLTMGIFFIGAGMIQSHKSIMDYQGYGRSHQHGTVQYLGPALWLPVHMWTNAFYNHLSVGSLYPTFNDSPLAQHMPDLYKQATLLRDSFDSGKGKLSLQPDAARVDSVHFDPDTNRHVVTIRFAAPARDFGEQLTLSQSQIRLIATPPGNSTGRAVAVHPDAWQQRVTGSSQEFVRFRFTSASYYITSIPGAEEVVVRIEFPGEAAGGFPRGYHAQFIQIRGTRFALPQPEEGEVPIDPDDLLGERVVLDTGRPNIDQFIAVNNGITPINASKNQQLGSLRLVDSYFAAGQHTFQGRGDRASPSLRVLGIYEPPMTRVVQLTMRSEHAHNIFQREILQRAPTNARIAIVDDAGNTYSPIGYLHEGRDGYTLRLDPQNFLPTIRDYPLLPDGGTDTLRIIFRVTEGVTIKGFVFGDFTMGLCDLPVGE